MQTYLHLLEQAISFSTQGTRLCCYWQGTTWLPQQELNSTDFHEMGKDQAYQFTSNDHQCINPLWSHLDFLPSQLLQEASRRSQQSNTPNLPTWEMFFNFHPTFFPRPISLLGQALLKEWGTTLILAKISENYNASIEQMYLEKKEAGNTDSIISTNFQDK